MNKMKFILIIVLLVLAGCTEDDPVYIENASPKILSITVFPEVLYLQDSANISCIAIDPDRDTLVYDWITDGRLKFKDGQGDGHFLYNTFENYRIVYPKKINYTPDKDTVWVQVFARDRKGKSDNKVILFLVIKDAKTNKPDGPDFDDSTTY